MSLAIEVNSFRGDLMIGVVLWSDGEEGKAVLWCEDQGDLAYYDTYKDQRDVSTSFGAGDMVQFDVTVESRQRRASNARLILEQAYYGLPETLREDTSDPNGAEGSAKIIPFKPHEKPHQQCRHSKLKA